MLGARILLSYCQFIQARNVRYASACRLYQSCPNRGERQAKEVLGKSRGKTLRASSASLRLGGFVLRWRSKTAEAQRRRGSAESFARVSKAYRTSALIG